MNPVAVATLIIAALTGAAGWAALFVAWLRSRNKSTADYANAAFEAWEQLATRQEQREAALLEEVSKLRREVGLLRRVLAKHGIAVTEADSA